MNVFYLGSTSRSQVDYDNENIIFTDQEGVLVECDMQTASTLAKEWGMEKPMYAKDGMWIAESSDVIFIVDGEVVDSIEEVAHKFGYFSPDKNGKSPKDTGISMEDFLREKNRVF